MFARERANSIRCDVGAHVDQLFGRVKFEKRVFTLNKLLSYYAMHNKFSQIWTVIDNCAWRRQLMAEECWMVVNGCSTEKQQNMINIWNEKKENRQHLTVRLLGKSWKGTKFGGGGTLERGKIAERWWIRIIIMFSAGRFLRSTTRQIFGNWNGCFFLDRRSTDWCTA